MIGRRSFLLAPLALAGCGLTAGGPVRVAVTWSDWELSRFRAVLDGFEHSHGTGTEIVPLGDDIGAVLGSRRGGAVDVVLLPQIGALRTPIANGLQALDRFAPPGRFPATWRTFLAPHGQVLGVPFKVAHKSVVWYRKALFAKYNEQPPKSWHDWLDLNARFADRGIAPLALGGADGWVLADFFENVLHGMDDRTHQALADGTASWLSSKVVAAFTEVARMWSLPGGLSGGASGALLTQAQDAVVDHFLRDQAAMIAGADFTYPVIARHGNVDVDWFHFPSQDGSARPPIVGADVVIASAPASPGALALVDWLAGKDAPVIWSRDGGLLSVHNEVDRATAYQSNRVADLAEEINEPGKQLVFGLADQLGAVGAGLRRELQNVLRAVDNPNPDVEDVGRQAAARMAKLAEGR